MKVFITKYALTKGILEFEVTEKDDMVSVGGNFLHNFHGEGKEWHRSINEARIRAEQMRLNKISQLKKQIQKLEKLKL